MIIFTKRDSSFIFILSFLLSLQTISGQRTDQKDSTWVLRVPGKPRVYNAMRLTTEKPVIDGKLDDPCWKTGEWAGDFTQLVPVQGGKPSQPTEFKMLYDDKNIYVAIRAYDSEPSKIQRIAGMRDDEVGDLVGVNFDSYHDHRTGFEFDLTAYGQKIDLLLTNPMTWDVNWDPVWTGKVGSEDSAWIAEMEVPLSQLRYSNSDEQVWGLHVWRFIGRLQEESDWEVNSITGPGVLYYFGELHGIKGLKKQQRLELMPYALGQLNTFPKDPKSPFAKSGRSWAGNAGLDAKIGIGSNFTMDVTISPDFGQVESDPSVMNLTAFETYYKEKRPFFMEGKLIFTDDFDSTSMFYSRRIGHVPSYSIPETDSLKVKSPDKTTIISAIKLSGKTPKGLSVGVLESLTASEYAKTSDLYGNIHKVNVEPLTNYLVTRIQKDYNEGATMLGGILTSTNRIINSPQLNFLAKDAFTGGLDLLHQFHDKEFFIEARLLGSAMSGDKTAISLLQQSSARYYQRPDSDTPFDSTRTHLNGYGGKLRIGKGSKGFWRYDTGITWMSPGLELNDLGYMTISDLLNQNNNINYIVNVPASIFRAYSVGLDEYNQFNFHGDYLLSGVRIATSAAFTNKWVVTENFTFISPSTDMRILRGGNSMKIPGQFINIGSLTGDINKSFYPLLLYQLNFGAENYLRTYSFTPGINYRPVTNLNIGVNVTYALNRNDLQYVAALTNPSRYILGRVDQKTLSFVFRFDFSLTPEISVQFYGSPFVSTGQYSYFKYITNPKASDYGNRFNLYGSPQILANKQVLLTSGAIQDIIDNPDFNFHQFRSNLVAKWEFRPGSFLYLVWSSDRTGSSDPTDPRLINSMKQIGNIFPNNIFLIKFNYWFSL